MLGKPVTRELLRAGFRVSLLARNVAKAKAIFSLANIIQGDVLDKQSLHAAFAGQDEIYINLHTPPDARISDQLPEREGIDNIVEAAKANGIRRLAILSSLVKRYNGTEGYNWWVFDVKEAAVKKIKSSGIPYTIYYASSFMETFDQLLLKNNKIMLAGKSRAKMWFVAGEDFGRQVAWAFSKLSDEPKEYIVQGLEPYNWDDAARIFIANYSRGKMGVLKAPLGMIQFLGRFSRKYESTFMVLKALNNYNEQFESQQTWDELGKPRMTLAAYAEKAGRKKGNKKDG
jgi:nucleoside-diphosphate-sugar epimerase